MSRIQRRILIYVSHVYLDGVVSGATLERGLIGGLLRRVQADSASDLRVFTVRRRGGAAADGLDDAHTTRLPLDKGSYLGFLALQWRVFWALARELWEHRDAEVAVFARYHDSMIAPALAAALFGRRLTIRATGVLPELRLHKKVGRLVELMVLASLWLHCRVASAVVSESTGGAEWLAQTFPFAAEKVRVIHNATDVRQFRPLPADRQRWGLPERGFVLGFVGTLDKAHDLATVLRAMAELPAHGAEIPHLLVVGDGPHQQEYRCLANDLGLGPYVVWAGRRPNEEVPEAIAACDLMLAPLTRECLDVARASSLKVFEYLACDKPVVVPACDDHAFVERQQLGWLAEPEDPTSWANGIRRAIESGRTALESRGRRLAEAEFGFDSLAEKVWRTCFGASSAVASADGSTHAEGTTQCKRL